MKYREILFVYALGIVGFVAALLVLQACTKEVRYMRHGEPCNSDKYDCQYFDTIP
jgi:hypothetical protein